MMNRFIIAWLFLGSLPRNTDHRIQENLFDERTGFLGEQTYLKLKCLMARVRFVKITSSINNQNHILATLKSRGLLPRRLQNCENQQACDIVIPKTSSLTFQPEAAVLTINELKESFCHLPSTIYYPRIIFSISLISLGTSVRFSYPSSVTIRLSSIRTPPNSK